MEILRSRGLFKRIVLEGKRVDGTFVRCSFLIHVEGTKSLEIGFKVSARKLNAARRNRIRRLMRASMDAERRLLDIALQAKGLQVGIIIFYKGAKEISVGRLKLEDIQKDFRFICRSIVSAL